MRGADFVIKGPRAMSAPQLEERPSPDPGSLDPVVAAAAPQPLPAWSRWLHEPLLHFVLLGGLLFAIDRIALGRANDPHLIVVGGEVDREAIELFRASRRRDPSAEELTALRRVWLDNEVLYRYGLDLGVD